MPEMGRVQLDEWGGWHGAPAICEELKIQACARPPGLPHGAHSRDDW